MTRDEFISLLAIGCESQDITEIMAEYDRLTAEIAYLQDKLDDCKATIEAQKWDLMGDDL